ncbi:hypothetical protein Ndes2437A_g08480 [Nannochloris sp. 'desiccata']
MSLSITSFSRSSLPSLPKRGVNRAIFRRCICAASNGIGRDKKPSSEGLDGIVAAVVAEPISFLGGMVAGFLALDVKQDPLKIWIDTRAAEAGLAYQAAKERLEEQQRNSSKKS